MPPQLRLLLNQAETVDGTARPVTYAVHRAVNNRYGWTHRDLLRKVHARAEGPLNELFAWVTQGTLPSEDPDLRLVHAFEQAGTGACWMASIRGLPEPDSVVVVTPGCIASPSHNLSHPAMTLRMT